ncbi:hypothetical protein [Nocardia huaxiensis]|uniref:Uncharacterized protein n=1 Tax=Nocardia huaxiensis TaxID=2755382 RepID=A0A7D6VBT5_9NOCA|nr:hypothetical protein [Nocardia huaxiensis]QLY32612.1 hypothetical protein H0264_10455 [Nocardia huaxiensis]UFS93660.1 hypothetical protein LPY97_22920 [Nocardia huaxiensis]
MKLTRTTWRRIRTPLILTTILLTYLALHQILAELSERHGYGSPDGLGLPYLAVAAATVGLRILLLVVVPAVLAYRAMAYAVTRLLRNPGERSGSASPINEQAGSAEHRSAE